MFERWTTGPRAVDPGPDELTPSQLRRIDRAMDAVRTRYDELTLGYRVDPLDVARALDRVVRSYLRAGVSQERAEAATTLCREELGREFVSGSEQAATAKECLARADARRADGGSGSA